MLLLLCSCVSDCLLSAFCHRWGYSSYLRMPTGVYRPWWFSCYPGGKAFAINPSPPFPGVNTQTQISWAPQLPQTNLTNTSDTIITPNPYHRSFLSLPFASLPADHHRLVYPPVVGADCARFAVVHRDLHITFIAPSATHDLHTVWSLLEDNQSHWITQSVQLHLVL